MTLRYMSKTRSRYKEVGLALDDIADAWPSRAIGELGI